MPDGLIYYPRGFSLRAKILDAVDQVILVRHPTMLAPARP
jgi:hypothetical protein